MGKGDYVTIKQPKFRPTDKNFCMNNCCIMLFFENWEYNMIAFVYLM